MTNKTFTVAGVSTQYGVTKVRFANDIDARVDALIKNDHTDIELIELEAELTKGEICKILLDHDKFQNEDAQYAITDFVVKNYKQVAKELKAANKLYDIGY